MLKICNENQQYSFWVARLLFFAQGYIFLYSYKIFLIAISSKMFTSWICIFKSNFTYDLKVSALPTFYWIMHMKSYRFYIEQDISKNFKFEKGSRDYNKK